MFHNNYNSKLRAIETLAKIQSLNKMPGPLTEETKKYIRIIIRGFDIAQIEELVLELKKLNDRKKAEHYALQFSHALVY